ncbi:hypothetical protein [Bacillus sp. PS06]|nr:hypothetical protein [Bacillus sp. PS06]
MAKMVQTKKERKKKDVVNEKHKDKAEAWQKLFAVVEARMKK